MLRREFIESSLENVVRTTSRALESEDLAKADGLLQRLDPRVKIVGFPALIVAAVVARNLHVTLAILGVSVVLALLSRVRLRVLATRVWIGVLAFTGLISLPAIFTTPGRVLTTLPATHWSISAQGVRSAIFLVARAETATSLSFLLVVCTPWAHVLKALRVLRVPVVVVVVLGMTYRYVFVLLSAAREMFESRRSRMVGQLNGSERRNLAAATAGVLMSRSLQLSEDVYTAMQSRGYHGEVYLLSDFRMRARDYAALCLALFGTAAALWLGR